MVRCAAALVAISLLADGGMAQAPFRGATYRVIWKAADFPKAEVHARVHSKDCTFRTSRKWASFFDGDSGWSRFISGLAARDSRGHALPIQALPDGRWRVGTGQPCSVQLRYVADFTFGKQVWSAGNEQVGYTTQEAIYATGLPLFVVGDDEPVEVEIIKPSEWVFATPWAPVGANRYRAASQTALIENTFVVGRTYTETFNAGRFHVTAALIGHPASSAEQFRTAFAKLAPALVATFNDDREGRYMFAVIKGSEDGESFEDSFAVSTENAPSQANRIIWANHLAHELIHYWLGKTIAPAPGDEAKFKWLTEGFTEYLANRTLLDTGIYSQADYLDRMSRHIGNYLLTRQNPLFMETSLQAAGAKGWANRPLIYSGGATLAFCLDARIRRGSSGARSLRDLMADLHARSQRGERLTDEAFISATSAAASQDIRELYAKYVVGTATLPVEQCAADAGLALLDQGYDAFLRAK